METTDSQAVTWEKLPCLGAVTPAEEWFNHREEVNRALARVRTLEDSMFAWLEGLVPEDDRGEKPITAEAYSLLKRCLGRLEESLYEMAAAIAKARSPETADSSTPVRIEDHHLEEAEYCLGRQLRILRQYVTSRKTFG